MHRSSNLLALAILAAAAPAAAEQAPLSPAAEDARLNAFLDAAYDARLELFPETMTQRGIKHRYGELNDYTQAGALRDLQLLRAQVAEMQSRFDPTRLSPAARLSFELYRGQLRQKEETYRWRDYDFLFKATGSPAVDIPSFLISSHRIDSVADAEAYVSRLKELGRVMTEVDAEFRRRTARGLVPPALVFDPAMAGARAVITGEPFTRGPDAPLWADFKAKIAKLDASPQEKARLLDAAKAALLGPVRQSYETSLASLAEAARGAQSNDGVWRLPDGEAYYASRVRVMTTTDLTPSQIHDLGLAEMQRIHGEMEKIKTAVGFNGTLPQFFDYIKSTPAFHYPNTDAGREAYLADDRAQIARVMAKAPQLFHRLPKAPLEVRPVESWRQAGGAVAYYTPGAPDGSRPGIVYVNLADMTQTLKPQATDLACHEGAPGHHFQISFAQETPTLPKFRRYGLFFTAYTEGWGLYAEGLCDELGIYRDPYEQFGRLSLDAWRAARLVTDTGLHAQHWSRERAVAYMTENTLLSDLDAQREIDRYLSMPGQATAYKVGQLRILQLRRRAQDVLGAKFDVRDFHDVVLSAGSLPLNVLDQQVDDYIARARQ